LGASLSAHNNKKPAEFSAGFFVIIRIGIYELGLGHQTIQLQKSSFTYLPVVHISSICHHFIEMLFTPGYQSSECRHQ
jgi:hypothetical protein